MSETKGAQRDYKINVLRISQRVNGKFRHIDLPVNWTIHIVKGRILTIGSKVSINFPQLAKIASFSGGLTPRKIVSAEITLDFDGSGGGNISFVMKSPLFALKDGKIELISDVKTYAC